MIMVEADIAQTVITHESALIHIAADTHNPTLTRVLPHRNVASVCEYGFFIQIHRYHQLIIVDFAYEVLIVEVAIGVEQGFLLIGFLHHLEETQQLVTKHVRRQSSRCLDVDHRDKILLARTALGLEVLQLLIQGCSRTEEMIGAHLQTVTVCQFDVTFIASIDPVATLCRLQIDVGHLGILANGLPENLTLIVRQVDTMHVVTSILALQIGIKIRIQQTGIGLGSLLGNYFLGLRALLVMTLALFHHSTRPALFLSSGTLGIAIADTHQSDT